VPTGYEKLFTLRPEEISLRTSNISVTILSYSLFMNNNFFFEQGVLQVQIIRFGRSKSLEMRRGKDTSKSVVVSTDISPDSTRWLVEP